MHGYWNELERRGTWVDGVVSQWEPAGVVAVGGGE